MGAYLGRVPSPRSFLYFFLRPIYTCEVSGDGDVRHLRASVNQREVSGEGDGRKRKHSVLLLPSPLPSPVVDLHSRAKVSDVYVSVSVSAYCTSVNWPLKELLNRLQAIVTYLLATPPTVQDSIIVTSIVP